LKNKSYVENAPEKLILESREKLIEMERRLLVLRR
jgi:hypothetical protein